MALVACFIVLSVSLTALSLVILQPVHEAEGKLFKKQVPPLLRLGTDVVESPTAREYACGYRGRDYSFCPDYTKDNY